MKNHIQSINIFLDKIASLLEAQTKDCILIGDINLNMLSETHVVREYKSTIESNAFEFQNTISKQFATRTTENTSTVLDHVIANKEIKCNSILEDHMTSEHKLLYISIEKIKIKHEKTKIT